MNKIFAGMMFVFLSFEIRLGAPTVHFPGGAIEIIQSPHILGLIPDFVGYALMASGLKELKEFSTRFSKIIPLVIIMIVVSIIVYVMDLLGMRYEFTPFDNLMPIHYLLMAWSLMMAAIPLFVSYSIVRGLKDIEMLKMVSFGSDTLYLAWKFKVTGVIIMVVSIFVPFIWIGAIIIGLGTIIYFLAAFYQSTKLFYKIDEMPNDERMGGLHNEQEDGKIDTQGQDQSHEQGQPESETDEEGKD